MLAAAWPCPACLPLSSVFSAALEMEREAPPPQRRSSELEINKNIPEAWKGRPSGWAALGQRLHLHGIHPLNLYHRILWRTHEGHGNGGVPVVSDASTGAKSHISLFQCQRPEQQLSKWWIRPQRRGRKVWWGWREAGNPSTPPTAPPHPGPGPRHILSYAEPSVHNAPSRSLGRPGPG